MIDKNDKLHPGATGLEVRGLTVAYGAQTVLENLSFTLPAGASLAIVGESGCGKTTLLTTLAGLLKPRSGTIRWRTAAGQDIPRLHSSFVWQGLGLFPWKTVRENLALPFALKNAVVPKAEGPARVEAMLTELGLKGLEDRWPAQLSGGQRQRLALGRALIADPEVLFMDEPFSALDALRRERLQDFLADLRVRRPVTMIFVTHDIAEAVYLASHVLLLAANPPRLIALYENPAWVAERQSARRDDPAFIKAAQHVHAELLGAARRAEASHEAEEAAR